MKALSITVIIPTYKPDAKLARLLRRLQKQTTPADRILLINTDESSFKESLIADVPEAEVIHIPKEDFDHGGTRAMAAAMCDTDLFVMMTMDAIPADRRLLENLTRAFDDPNVAVAYGRQLPGKDSDILEMRSRVFNYGPENKTKSAENIETEGIKAFFCSDVCAAYRRDLYEELGGFVQRTIFNEDMIFARKVLDAGYSIAYRADARVFHAHSYTAMQQLHRNFDLGVSHAEYPEIFGDVSSESEGIRMVKENALWLLKHGELRTIPRLIRMSAAKYIGYRLGKKYEKLPFFMIRRLTMNKGYWEK